MSNEALDINTFLPEKERNVNRQVVYSKQINNLLKRLMKIL